jgi:hypothetical protein
LVGIHAPEPLGCSVMAHAPVQIVAEAVVGARNEVAPSYWGIFACGRTATACARNCHDGWAGPARMAHNDPDSATVARNTARISIRGLRVP